MEDNPKFDLWLGALLPKKPKYRIDDHTEALLKDRYDIVDQKYLDKEQSSPEKGSKNSCDQILKELPKEFQLLFDSIKQLIDINQIIDYFKYHYQPYWSTSFDSIVETQISGPGTYVLSKFEMPVGNNGVLKFVGQGCTDSTIYNYSTWTLKINDYPLPYWPITTQKGSILSPSPETILLNSGDIVTMVVTTTSGPSYPVSISSRLKGWYW